MKAKKMITNEKWGAMEAATALALLLSSSRLMGCDYPSISRSGVRPPSGWLFDQSQKTRQWRHHRTGTRPDRLPRASVPAVNGRRAQNWYFGTDSAKRWSIFHSASIASRKVFRVLIFSSFVRTRPSWDGQVWKIVSFYSIARKYFTWSHFKGNHF